MKRILLGLLGTIALAIPGTAQPVPQTGVTFGYVPKATYSSAFFGLVPVTGATDVVCITGSASKTVRLQRMVILGTTATAVQSFPVQLVRRAAVDTLGTIGVTTANPGITTQIARHDAALAGTATASLVSYTANPTINDAAPVYLDSKSLTMPIVTSVTSVGAGAADFNYITDNVNLLSPPTVYGVAQQICANFGAVAITNASTLNGVVVWTEE